MISTIASGLQDEVVVSTRILEPPLKTYKWPSSVFSVRAKRREEDAPRGGRSLPEWNFPVSAKFLQLLPGLKTLNIMRNNFEKWLK